MRCDVQDAKVEGKAPEGPLAEYVLLPKILGSGNLGIVYQGEKRTTQAAVAIKRYKLDANQEMVKQEMLACTRLQNRFNLVQFVQAIEDAGDSNHPKGHALVFEYCEGDLHEYVRRRKGRHLSGDEAVNLALQLASGLCELHESCNMLHRDLNLKNVLFQVDKNKIVTFKIGDYTETRERSIAALRIGSRIPGSLVNESLFVDDSVGRTSEFTWEHDVYALGVVLWTVFTLEYKLDNLPDTVGLARAMTYSSLQKLSHGDSLESKDDEKTLQPLRAYDKRLLELVARMISSEAKRPTARECVDLLRTIPEGRPKPGPDGNVIARTSVNENGRDLLERQAQPWKLAGWALGILWLCFAVYAHAVGSSADDASLQIFAVVETLALASVCAINFTLPNTPWFLVQFERRQLFPRLFLIVFTVLAFAANCMQVVNATSPYRGLAGLTALELLAQSLLHWRVALTTGVHTFSKPKVFWFVSPMLACHNLVWILSDLNRKFPVVEKAVPPLDADNVASFVFLLATVYRLRAFGFVSKLVSSATFAPHSGALLFESELPPIASGPHGAPHQALGFVGLVQAVFLLLALKYGFETNWLAVPMLLVELCAIAALVVVSRFVYSRAHTHMLFDAESAAVVLVCMGLTTCVHIAEAVDQADQPWALVIEIVNGFETLLVFYVLGLLISNREIEFKFRAVPACLVFLVSFNLAYVVYDLIIPDKNQPDSLKGAPILWAALRAAACTLRVICVEKFDQVLAVRVDRVSGGALTGVSRTSTLLGSGPRSLSGMVSGSRHVQQAQPSLDHYVPLSDNDSEDGSRSEVQAVVSPPGHRTELAPTNA